MLACFRFQMRRISAISAQAFRVKLALSTLCENPRKRTGLSTLFPAFVAAAVRLFPDVFWLVFASHDEPWPDLGPRVNVVRRFAANDRRAMRLWSDHLRVGSEAERRGADALLTVGFVPLRCRLPVIMQVCALPSSCAAGPANWLRTAYRVWALRAGLRRAALVITNSAWAAGRLGALDRGRRCRLVVSPEGVDHAQFSPEPGKSERDRLTRELGIPPRYLLWLSNFYAYKRAELALAAFAALPAKLRTEYPFVLAGGDWQGGVARARRAAARCGVDRDVRFLGRVNEAWLPALYRNARAQVMATSEETFGRNLLEAMACGCPTVANDLPVLREVAGGGAEFTDFARTPEAGEALRRICKDDVLAGRVRDRGIARAAEFSFERLARERVNAVIALLEPEKALVAS
jgi:glycosyltransferase involved in cell wall biosynthesis